MYLRYVDDIFTVFSGTANYLPFLHALNRQHKNLEFTVEIGNDHLAFLDTQISIKDANFESWVYRKPTNTNVLLNQSAVCPVQWKNGLIKCLLNRAWVICSNYRRLHEEIEKLRSIFSNNGYPIRFFDKIVKQYLLNKWETNCKTHKDNSLDVEKRYIMKIPYVGKASVIFKCKFSALLRQAYDVNVQCVFDSCKVKNYF